MRKVFLCLTVSLALVCASCAGKDAVYPVSGKVTYKGVPAAGAVVTFHRRGGDSLADPTIMGVAQQDGSFEVVCGARGRGAPPGDYDVLIEWTRFTGPTNRRPQAGPDILRGRFADPKNPRFHAEIKAGANKLPPFELTD